MNTAAVGLDYEVSQPTVDPRPNLDRFPRNIGNGPGPADSATFPAGRTAAKSKDNIIAHSSLRARSARYPDCVPMS
jgi:hypothetical protein